MSLYIIKFTMNGTTYIHNTLHSRDIYDTFAYRAPSNSWKIYMVVTFDIASNNMRANGLCTSLHNSETMQRVSQLYCNDNVLHSRGMVFSVMHSVLCTVEVLSSWHTMRACTVRYISIVLCNPWMELSEVLDQPAQCMISMGCDYCTIGIVHSRCTLQRD